MESTGTAVGQRLRAELERVIAGNEAATFGVLVALLAGGHVLLEGVPGTAETAGNTRYRPRSPQSGVLPQDGTVVLIARR